MEGGIVIKEAISSLVSGSGNEGALPRCFNSGSAIFSCDIFSGDRACFITDSGSIVSDSRVSDIGSLALACLLTD